MVDLGGKLHDEALRLLKRCRYLIIILQRLLPLFIQLRVPVLQAYDDVQELCYGLFELLHFFFAFFLDILDHFHPLSCNLFTGEREIIPLFLELLDCKVLLPDDSLVTFPQLPAGFP